TSRAYGNLPGCGTSCRPSHPRGLPRDFSHPPRGRRCPCLPATPSKGIHTHLVNAKGNLSRYRLTMRRHQRVAPRVVRRWHSHGVRPAGPDDEPHFGTPHHEPAVNVFRHVHLACAVSRLSVKPASASRRRKARDHVAEKVAAPGEIKRYDMKPEAPRCPQ